MPLRNDSSRYATRRREAAVATSTGTFGKPAVGHEHQRQVVRREVGTELPAVLRPLHQRRELLPGPLACPGVQFGERGCERGGEPAVGRLQQAHLLDHRAEPVPRVRVAQRVVDDALADRELLGEGLQDQ